MIDVENPILMGIFILFAITVLVQLWYYLYAFSRLAFYKDEHTETVRQEPVSIIICARNELENLRKNLEPILQQEYRTYEVIVVNDCSYDESGELHPWEPPECG